MFSLKKETQLNTLHGPGGRSVTPEMSTPTCARMNTCRKPRWQVMPIWGFPTSCPASWEGEKVESRAVGQGSSCPSAVDGAAGGASRLPTPVCLSVCLSLRILQPVRRDSHSYPAAISWHVITSSISDLITALSIYWTHRSRLRFSEPHLMMEKPSQELALRSPHVQHPKT